MVHTNYGEAQITYPQIPYYEPSGNLRFSGSCSSSYLANNPSIKPTIWQSLGTKNHVDAMRKSKRMWVMFDGIINQFSNPKVRSKATDLLIGYFEAKAGVWRSSHECE